MIFVDVSIPALQVHGQLVRYPPMKRLDHAMAVF